MEYNYFFHLTSPFSNFHPAKFEYKKLTFISNEQFMMKVKKLGRCVQNYDEAYWESRRYKIVLFGVRLKFTQNPELKDILMATGESRMIEENPYDKVWAAGLSEYDCKRIPEEKYKVFMQ